MQAIRLEKVSKRYYPGYGQGRSLRAALPRILRRLRRKPALDDESRAFWALKEIDLAVEKGEALGVVGPNGAGKSTILKLLSGITRPTQGRVTVKGKVSALIEVGAGFHPELTGRENVYLNGAIRGLSRKEIDRKFDQIVEFAELEQFIDVPVKRYSSGMYMRLGFAVAAHVDPDVLLIDEILAVGDLRFHWKCLERIKKLRQDKKTIVFVSHNMDAVRSVCDRAVLIEHGVVSCAGETDGVVAAYRGCMLRDQEAHLRSKEASPSEDRAHVARPDVEINDIRLLGVDGKECTAFQTGDTLIVQVDYTAHKAIEDPVFAIAVHASDGTYCHSPNTSCDHVTTGKVYGEGQFQVVLPDLHLLPNTYFLSAWVLESSNLLAYDSRERALVFRVESPRSDEGLFYLDHTWQLRHGKHESGVICELSAPSNLINQEGDD